MTNLFAGWQEGARQLEGGPDATISRVILLSDGQGKLARLRVLAEHDPEMMCKEVRFSAMRMSSRLSAMAEPQ